MTVTTSSAQTANVQINDSPFLKSLVQQIRVNDSHGTYRNWSDDLLVKPFIVSREKKREISVEGEIDSITKGKILVFYRAIAHCIEQETEQLTQVVIDLSHEGFGWALIFSGHLLVVSKTLRDAQRFGFESLEKLALEGDKLIKSGIDYIRRFPEVAKS